MIIRHTLPEASIIRSSRPSSLKTMEPTAAVSSKLKRLEERWKRNYEQTIEMMLRIEQEIELIPEARTRAILRARIIRQEPQKKIAIDFDLTEARISQIIKEALDE